MGCGIASGENRAIEAAQKAISSPLLEGVSIKGAKNILLNVSGSSSMTMQEIEAGNNVIFEAAGEETNVIFGVVNMESLTEYVSYTVIATGFESRVSAKPISNLRNEKIESKPENRVVNLPSGFSTKKGMDLEKNDNLNIPAILRYSKGDPDLFGRGVNIDAGFRNVKSEYTEDNFNSSPKDNEEEDSSSFLRKIMD